MRDSHIICLIVENYRRWCKIHFPLGLLTESYCARINRIPKLALRREMSKYMQTQRVEIRPGSSLFSPHKGRKRGTESRRAKQHTHSHACSAQLISNFGAPPQLHVAAIASERANDPLKGRLGAGANA